MYINCCIISSSLFLMWLFDVIFLICICPNNSSIIPTLIKLAFLDTKKKID